MSNAAWDESLRNTLNWLTQHAALANATRSINRISLLRQKRRLIYVRDFYSSRDTLNRRRCTEQDTGRAVPVAERPFGKGFA